MNKLCCLIIMLLACRICNAQFAVEKRYITPGNTNYPVYGIATHTNGDFVVSSINSYSGNNHVVIMRVDSIGNILWSKEYSNGSAWSDQNVSNADGGNTIKTNKGIVRIDSGGNILWSKTYLADTLQSIVYLNTTNDKGFIMSGLKKHSPKDAGILIKTDSLGNVLLSPIYLES